MLITLATIAPKRLIRLTTITNTEVFPKYSKLRFYSEFTSGYTTCQISPLEPFTLTIYSQDACVFIITSLLSSGAASSDVPEIRFVPLFGAYH